jgi:AraC-like DNA-binding protein
MPPGADASGGMAGSHELRPGMSMRWRNGGLRAEEPSADVTACFVFVLHSIAEPALDGTEANPFGTVGWMTLVPRAGLSALRARARNVSFHLIVELGGSVLQEIFHQEPEQAKAEIFQQVEKISDPVLRPLTPAARLAVESVRRCPLVGACRALVLGARCHDLLVEFISAQNAAPARPAPMMSDTETRVRAAAASLSRRLDLTPSLEALAREAGLSETTLKRGFRQVYGTTVFDHLRTLRMERARELLQSGQATVIEAATLVGYSNPSNFAAAFRRQFGLNPKEFQMAARR